MALFSVSDQPDVDRLVETCGYAAAALTILPIPGSEVLGVMPLHVGMVIGIAHHRGRTITRESATSLLLQIGGTVGLSLVGSRIATTAAKLILPGLGGLVAAPFMYASTLAIGSVADAFFRSEGGLSESEMRDLYNRTVREAKSSFRPERMREASAVDHAASAVAQAKEPEPESPVHKLKHAKELLEQGLISQEEFDEVKKRVLGDL
ncbi:MAG: SHOCT domain-containing protein [Myxococcota bacterium]